MRTDYPSLSNLVFKLTGLRLSNPNISLLQFLISQFYQTPYGKKEFRYLLAQDRGQTPDLLQLWLDLIDHTSDLSLIKIWLMFQQYIKSENCSHGVKDFSVIQEKFNQEINLDQIFPLQLQGLDRKLARAYLHDCLETQY